jgi:hypothetical protein
MRVQDPAAGSTMTSMSHAPEPVPATAPGRRKPITLYVLVALMVVKSILIMIALGGAFTLADDQLGQALRMPGAGKLIRETPGAAGVLIIVAAVLLVSALMLLAGRRTGWLLAMVITGVSVAIDVVGFVAGTGSELWMFLNVVTVFYLNQRDIRELVGVTVEPVLDVPPQTVAS